MAKRPFESVRLGVEALDCRLVPAVDAFIWFHSEAPTSTVAAQQTTKAFEIKDFSFGVENPTTIGSATGGAGAGVR
jgi:hypothetical protein